MVSPHNFCLFNLELLLPTRDLQFPICCGVPKWFFYAHKWRTEAGNLAIVSRTRKCRNLGNPMDQFSKNCSRLPNQSPEWNLGRRMRGLPDGNTRFCIDVRCELSLVVLEQLSEDSLCALSGRLLQRSDRPDRVHEEVPRRPLLLRRNEKGQHGFMGTGGVHGLCGWPVPERRGQRCVQGLFGGAVPTADREDLLHNL